MDNEFLTWKIVETVRELLAQAEVLKKAKMLSSANKKIAIATLLLHKATHDNKPILPDALKELFMALNTSTNPFEQADLIEKIKSAE